MTVPHAEAARVVVYSRADCHLCAVAESIVAQVCEATGVAWVRVDIDEDPTLTRLFTDQVPVTYVDGSQHDFWRVDPLRLRQAIERH